MLHSIQETGVPPRIGAGAYPHPFYPSISVRDFTIHDVPGMMESPNIRGMMRGKGGGSDRWATGGESLDEQVDGARNGWTKHLAEARALFAKTEAKIPIESLAQDWDLGVAGAFPCVPEVVAGNPESMFFMDEEDNAQLGAVRIWLNTASSSGVPDSTLRARGNAVMALCMVLSAVRPVEAWAYMSCPGNGKDAMIRCKVSDAPLDVSQASYPLLSQAYGRSFSHSALADTMGFSSIPYLPWQSKTDEELLRPGPSDVIVPCARNGDTSISADPAGWVKKQVDSILARDGEGQNQTLPEWAKG